MAQEQQNIPLDQGTMMTKFTEIAKWMQVYEQQISDRTLSESEKTPILPTEGFCFGLSALLIHCVITELQIEAKRQSTEPIKEPTQDNLYSVEGFFNRIKEVNALTDIPPKNVDPKAFFSKMNVLMLELVQLHAGGRKEIPQHQDMETILNEASEGNPPKKRLHTYVFTDNSQFLEWGQKAKLGDTLHVSAEGHAMAMYVRKNRAGEQVVGFYDPNSTSTKPIEILQSELKKVEQIANFLAVHNAYARPGKDYPAFVICNHITLAKEDIKFPEIADSPLNVSQLRAALVKLSHSQDHQHEVIKGQIALNNMDSDIALIQYSTAYATDDSIKYLIAPQERINNLKALSAAGNNTASISLLKLDEYDEKYKIDIASSLEDFAQRAQNNPMLSKALMDYHITNLPYKEANEYYTKMIAPLLKQGADVNTLTSSGISLLDRITERASNEVMSDILSYNPSLKANKFGQTPLHIAASANNIGALEAILDKNPEILNIITPRGSPLHVAIEEGHINSVIMLCDRGANVDSTTLSGRHTPLSLAINGTTAGEEIVGILLKKGASMSEKVLNLCIQQIKDPEPGFTPTLGPTILFYAAEKNKPDIVEKLLAETNTNLFSTDSNHQTALDIAKANGSKEVIEMLETKILAINIAKSIANDMHIAESSGGVHSPPSSPHTTRSTSKTQSLN